MLTEGEAPITPGGFAYRDHSPLFVMSVSGALFGVGGEMIVNAGLVV